MSTSTPTDSGNHRRPQLLSAEQVDEWAGVRLTDAQLTRLAAAIPYSSIPEAIATIVLEALDIGDDSDACRDPFDIGCRASLDDGQGWAGCCGHCADRMEHIHHGQDWGDECSPSDDGSRCTSRH
jgi:hypothetical protein